MQSVFFIEYRWNNKYKISMVYFNGMLTCQEVLYAKKIWELRSLFVQISIFVQVLLVSFFFFLAYGST